jgi:hypothetical protein
MVYIPYKTTITAGDITRDTSDYVAKTLGSKINFMRRMYTKTTGYTQQNYRTANTITKQATTLPQVRGVNKLTVNTDITTNLPKASPPMANLLSGDNGKY